jgi:SpoU rRNA methylase family enzyme
MSESGISVFWRICFDHDGDVLTLPGLREEIHNHMPNGAFKDDFRRRLKKIRFNKRLASLGKRITTVRHGHVAHFNRKKTV